MPTSLRGLIVILATSSFKCIGTVIVTTKENLSSKRGVMRQAAGEDDVKDCLSLGVVGQFGEHSKT